MLLEISQNSQEKTCTTVIFLNKAAGLQILVQVLSCESCEISKNTFFTEHLWATASIIIWIFTDFCIAIISTKFVAQRRNCFRKKVAGPHSCNFIKQETSTPGADSGLVKLVVMTYIFFNNQQHKIKIKRFLCVKEITTSFFSNS